jgi:hypothetical protein
MAVQVLDAKPVLALVVPAFPRLEQPRLVFPRQVLWLAAFRKLVSVFPTRARQQPRYPTKPIELERTWLKLAVGLSDPAPPSVRQTSRPVAVLVPCEPNVVAAWEQD